MPDPIPCPWRPLPLPDGIAGQVWLHSMPGRCTRFEDDLRWMAENRVARVLCLVGEVELVVKSPAYHGAIRQGSLPCAFASHPIDDFSPPADRVAFGEFVAGAAETLRSGGNLLVHCAAGIGRTGLFAVCLLLALGVGLERAYRTVLAAGSCPEDPEQEAFIRDFAREAGAAPP